MNVLTDAQMELMRRRLADAGIAGDQEAAVAEDTRPEPSDGDLGVAERRMWKIYELDPESISHNHGVFLEFDDAYSVEAVIASFERLVNASAVLSSVIADGDDGLPRRAPNRWDGRWVVHGQVWEWGSMPETGAAEGQEYAEVVRGAASVLSTAPFRLRQDPPIRARVYARPNGGVSMVLVLHHLAFDETALPRIIGGLVARPEAAVSETRAPRTVTRRGAALDRAVRHATETWAAEGIRYPLSGALPETSPEQSWLSAMTEGSGAYLTHPIDRSDVSALAGVARTVGATPNAVFIVVSALSIAAMTGADDYVLLVPADNRQPEDAPDQVGYCGNVVPMRFTIDPAASTKDALRAAVSTVYDAMEFSSVDYGPILTALRGAGGRFPVAEVMVLVRNAPLRGVPVPDGASVSCETVFKGVVHYPLSLAFEISEDDRVHLEIEYRTDVLDTSYARRAANVVAELVARVPRSLDRPVAELFDEIRSAVGV
ncbi:condensation domain-containing protein [Nocardia sp. NPDC050175]|uniref:condensation domain-containing protein n=1 Tax=Nocardia sp. NPDC050175 TaxID=3364317 RepID=UPI00378A0AE4